MHISSLLRFRRSRQFRAITCVLLVCLALVIILKQYVLTSQQPFQTWNTGGSVRSLLYSPDGQMLASVETTSPDPTREHYVVRLRHIPTGQIISTLGGQSEKIYTLAFSHNGQLLASGDQGARVQLWRVRDGALLATMTGHTAPIQQVLFDHDDTILLSVSDDYTIRQWSIPDGTAQRMIRWSAYYNCGSAQVGFVGKEARFAVRDVADIIVRSFPDQHTLQTIQGFEKGDCSDFEKVDIRFNADAHLLASVDTLHGRSETIRVWDLSARRMIAALDGHTDLIASVAFSSDNRLIASASGIPYYFLYTNGDRSVRIWRLADGQSVAVFDKAHYGVITGLAFSPDNQVLASGGVDGAIRFWRIPP
jgi:WD40 repeat protein